MEGEALDSTQAEEVFDKMLREHAGSVDAPDPKLAWEAWLNFVRLPMECKNQGLLFEWGPENSRSFFFHFDRYCYVEDGCHLTEGTFNFPMRPELAQFEGTVQRETNYVETGVSLGDVVRPEETSIYDSWKLLDPTWDVENRSWLKFVDMFIDDVGDLSGMWELLSGSTPTNVNVYVGLQ